MLKVNIDLWVLMICLVISFISLIITFLLLFSKGPKNQNRKIFPNRQVNKHEFESEIAFQMTLQQLDYLLMNTINEIEKQRRFIQNFVEDRKKTEYYNSSMLRFDENEMIHQVPNGKTLYSISKECEEKTDDHKSVSFSSPSDSKYDHIADLFQAGMNSKQIAERLQIPQSEIDLYIKLHLSKDASAKKQSSLLRFSV